MKKLYFVFYLAFLALMISCSGGGSSGGGGSTNDHAPVISSLGYIPTRAALNEGGGAVTLIYKFDFIDIGGDITALTGFYYDQNGRTIYLQAQPPSVSGKTTGTLYYTYSAPTTVRGSTTWGIFVTDSTGKESNRLTGSFTVY